MYSAEDEEDGTDPICSQQRGRKRRKRQKNKTKTTAELQAGKLTTGNNKTHETLFIICQKNKKRIAPIGTAPGKKAILRVPKKKDDLVLARIQSTNSSDTFVYHSGNVCYKPYIISKTKSQHEDENVGDNERDTMVKIDDVPSRNLPASGTLREKPSSRKNIREIKCVICDKFTKTKIYDKRRLCIMAKNKLDDVYNCISDCTDIHKLYGADLYYHNTGMTNYVRKSESVNNSDSISNSNEVEDFAHNSHQELDKFVASLIFTLLGFTLSEVKDKVNKIMHPNQIHNYQVKSFLIRS